MPPSSPPSESRAVVPWKYQNPFVNNRHAKEVTLYLHGQSFQVAQDQQAQVTLHQGTGRRLWDGAYILSRYLESWPQLSHEVILELGSGCGVVSLAVHASGARVTATDQEEAMSLLQQNIRRNVPDSSRMHVCTLDWTQPVPKVMEGAYSLILASEILYLPALHSAILTTLSSALRPDGKALFLYHQRGLGEEAFLAKATHRGFTLHQIPEEDLDTEFHGQGYQCFLLSR